MHTNVHYSTVYNSKDLESAQMPIDDRPDWENVVHIHHGILCSNQKWWVCVVFRNKDESGEHHPQQTDTRTENEIPRVLTHRRVLNNENTWTQGGEDYTLWSVGENRGGTTGGVGSWREIAWGEMTDVGEGVEGSKSHCHVCTYAMILHILHMYPQTKNAIKKIL